MDHETPSLGSNPDFIAVIERRYRKGYDSAMSEPITLAVLGKFHRDVIVPDIQRIVGDAVSASEGRLRNEMQAFHDSILKKLGDLETESAAIKIGLKRVKDRLELVETRLGQVEDRLEKVEGRLDKVEQRLDSVKNDLRQLDERLSRVEKRIDEIAEPQPGLRAEVQQLKMSIESLQGRIDALERRADQS